MRSDALDGYRHRASPVHGLAAGWKCLAALALVVCVVLLPRGAWVAHGAAGALLFGVALLARLPLGHVGRRLLLVEPFVIGVALLSLFRPDGLAVFLSTITKSTICLLAMVVLAATTRFSDVLLVLSRARVPRLLVTTLALTYRYLFVLVDETGRTLRARRSRTFVRSRRRAWASAASVAGGLFVRASERAERVWAAMCARGWR